MLTTDNLADLELAIEELEFGNYTNWDDALSVAQDQFGVDPFAGPPQLVVMITDGHPNRWNSDPVLGAGVDDDDNNQIALNEAIEQANAIKAAPNNTHMFALGVTGDLGLDTAALKAISGDEEYPEHDFAEADWAEVGTFAALQPLLKDVATDLCGGTVLVKKTVDSETPGSPWTFSGPGGTPTPDDGMTNDEGRINFAYDFDSDASDPMEVEISETQQDDYTLDPVVCTDSEDTVVATEMLADDDGVSLMVGPEDIITCGFNNASPAVVTTDVVPGIDIVKSGPATAHEGDKITYKFIVTNTGDGPLTDVVVTDDVLGEIGTIDSLAPGASQSFEKTYTTPVQSADAVNIAEACGTDANGGSICDEATHSTDLLHPAITLVKTANPVAIIGSGDVAYTYVVTNTGDVVLSGTSITDDILGPISTLGNLEPGRSATIMRTVSVKEGSALRNVGTAIGTDTLGREVKATDDAVISFARAVPLEVLGVAIVAPADLPRTGSSSRVPLMAGTGLLLAGMATTLVARKRRLTA